MTLRTRSKVFWAFLALPFQMRHCSRSTSVTIVALARVRPGSSVGNPLAASFACCSRMAMWNQSAIGGVVTPALARNDRRSRQPCERSHLCGSGSPDCLEAPTDLNCNVGVGSGDGAEH